MELLAGLSGAVVGALIAGILGFLQLKWSEKQTQTANVERDKRSLVREIMRLRLDQRAVIAPLNEVPLLFGDDADVMRHYREMLDSVDGTKRTQAFGDLINRLAKAVGLPSQVQTSDMHRGFTIGE